MLRLKLVGVPWTLRAQPETPNSPAQPKRRVEVQMEPDTYRLFLRLRAKVFDGERLLLEGDELHAALDEMHNLVEMTFMLGAQVTAQPPVEEDHSARTEALAAVERLESEKGWKVPDVVKASLGSGQTTLLAERPRAAVDLLPDFDGETYIRALDHERLGQQLLRVGKLMGDGGWHMLSEISDATGDPEASVSARLRDLRKTRFGGHTVNRERMDGGQFRYRLVLVRYERPWEGESE